MKESDPQEDNWEDRPSIAVVTEGPLRDGVQGSACDG